jgi:hypothetical protein
MNKSPKQSIACLWTIALAVCCLQGCVPMQLCSTKQNGKSAKGDCCESCQKQKMGNAAAQKMYAPAPSVSLDRKVMPDQVTADNYQKLLKNLEEEVGQGTGNP